MLKRYLLIIILLISILPLLFISCRQELFNGYVYQAPESIGDGFEVGSLEEVNLDPALIEKAVNEINRGKYGEVHSMLIIKDNKLVFEEYFTGHKYQWDGENYHGELLTWDTSISHVMHSVTKSITSTCIGITIDKGFIQSVNQSIFDYLPEHQLLNTDGKSKITIKHLLTMRSGLEWDEWEPNENPEDTDTARIWFHDEGPIAGILKKQLIYEPGIRFHYSGGNMIVLGEIIKNATGMSLDEFSRKYIFEPLEIDAFSWYNRFNDDVIEAAAGLKMTPRDMAKIGAVFLNKGVWNEKQIVSGQWVEKSSIKYQGPSNSLFNNFQLILLRRGYSYSWWTHQFSNSGKKINMFFAEGWGGQLIMVLPELDTVVVLTGGNYVSYKPPIEILKRYIVPAIK